MIKKLTLWLMKYQLKKAEQDIKLEMNTIVRKAKINRIEAYKTTILFLE